MSQRIQKLWFSKKNYCNLSMFTVHVAWKKVLERALQPIKSAVHNELNHFESDSMILNPKVLFDGFVAFTFIPLNTFTTLLCTTIYFITIESSVDVIYFTYSQVSKPEQLLTHIRSVCFEYCTFIFYRTLLRRSTQGVSYLNYHH